MRFIIEGKPYVKGRPRVTKQGHSYTPKTTAAYEKAVSAAFIEAGGMPDNLQGNPLWVDIALFDDLAVVNIVGMTPQEPAVKLRGDVDNYAKAILDGMQIGTDFDDGDVVSLSITKGRLA